MTAGEACPNCASPIVRRYCADCGELQPAAQDSTLRSVGAEVVQEFVSVDRRLWRSIVALLTSPGALTLAYFGGNRGRYMRPFSLFVLLNVVFFVARPYTGLLRYDHAMYTDVDGLRDKASAKQQSLGVTRAEFVTRFDLELEAQKKSMLLFVVPLFALGVAVLHADRRRRLAEHLVFSVHTYAFLLFLLLAIGTLGYHLVAGALRLVGAPATAFAFVGSEQALVLVLGLGMCSYMTVALRRVYRSSWPAAALRSVALFVVQGALVRIYKILLFHTTLASL